MTTLRYGATAEEWAEFSLVYGLTADLLPVVSNPNAKIGESSKLKKLGKTPSRYNKQGTVGGILDWSTKIATAEEVAGWSRQPDYGICIQTRRIRAIDVDINDAAICTEIADLLENFAQRTRSNATKFLVAFELPGNYSKRTIKTAHGIIEFLANGQQFIAAGTHDSGVRYEWKNGVLLNTMTPDTFEYVWKLLQDKYGIEPSTTSTTSDRKEKLHDAISEDPTAAYLVENHFVLSTERDGRLHIRCPFESEHTDLGTGSESATTYFPRFTGGYSQGHFKCLHAHCAQRSDGDFISALGLVASDFADLDAVRDRAADGEHVARESSTTTAPAATPARRYEFQQAQTFAAQGGEQSWFIKSILPQADLAVVFGESGSGKSFFTLDLACHIAQGKAYRGKKVLQAGIAYIAAEGAGGFRNRINAYAHHHEIDLATLDLSVLAAAPNFMRRDNVDAVRDAVLALPIRPGLIIVDTFAQVTPGANENSGEDVGKALGHARQLRVATGAMILLIHHSGKDATKGARGWSGLNAAADAEFEITHTKGVVDRQATITKLKDGQDQFVMGFKLDVVQLGLDADGEAITSCVVIPTDAAAASPRTLLGDLERLTLKVLEDLEGLTAEPVKINDLLEAVVSQRVPPAGRDTRRQVVGKTLDRLVEKGVVSLDGGVVRRTP